MRGQWGICFWEEATLDMTQIRVHNPSQTLPFVPGEEAKLQAWRYYADLLRSSWPRTHQGAWIAPVVDHLCGGPSRESILQVPRIRRRSVSSLYIQSNGRYGRSRWKRYYPCPGAMHHAILADAHPGGWSAPLTWPRAPMARMRIQCDLSRTHVSSESVRRGRSILKRSDELPTSVRSWQ